MPRTLIVGGCPRSGTTALMRLLNCHPGVSLGDERYYWRFERGELSPGLFEPDRFFDLREADRHWAEGRDPLPGVTRAAYEAAAWRGDKYPPLWRAFEAIEERLPGARILCVVRNPLSVAESYAARAADEDDAWPFGASRAIADWNRAVRAGFRAVEAGRDVAVVAFESVFAPGADLAPLFAALGLDAGPALGACEDVTAKAARLFRRDKPTDEGLRREVCLGADFAAYERLSAHCLYRRAAPNPACSPRVRAA